VVEGLLKPLVHFPYTPWQHAAARNRKICYSSRRERLPALLLFRALFDVFNDVSDGLQFFRVLIRNLNGKFFFKGHDQFHNVERIGPQIFDERRLGRDLLGIYPQLFDNDVLDLFFDCFVGHRITLVGAQGLPHTAQHRK
jgi:hypothetical protein